MRHVSGLSAIPVTRVSAVYRTDRKWSPPPALAVTVRGALGRALFDIACIRAHRECRGCDVGTACLIPGWFRVGGQAPPPYALAVEAYPWSREILATISFFGVIPRPELVTEALVRLGRVGLGPERVPHVLQRLHVQGAGAPTVVIADETHTGIWPAPARLVELARPAVVTDTVDLHLVTPLQTTGNPRPTPASVVQAAVLRTRAVARACGIEILHRWPDPAGLALDGDDLRFVAGKRYSRVSGGDQDLSGWIGTLRLRGPTQEFGDLLAAAEVLHVGRGVGAGLGRVRVEDARS